MQEFFYEYWCELVYVGRLNIYEIENIFELLNKICQKISKSVIKLNYGNWGLIWLEIIELISWSLADEVMVYVV